MKKIATLCIILAASLWGSMGIFVRKIDDCDFTSLEIVFIRAMGTCFILFLFLLLFQRKLLLIKRRDIWIFLGSGILSITFFNMCYFITITRTSLSIAAILLYTAPSFVILISSKLFKETITTRKIISLLLSFLGCAFISGITEHSTSMRLADLLIGIGAGLGYALYSIFGRFALNRNYSTLTISFYTFLFSAISTLPFFNLSKTAIKLYHHPKIIPILIYMVLFITIAGYGLYTYGLKHMEAGNASIIACIEPVMATILGYLAYRETLTPWELFGILLVIFSSIIVNLSIKLKEVANESF